MFFNKFIQTDNSSTTILIRLMVGLVFFTEGVQKFIYPAALGVGRFTAIGLPAPEFFACLVGILEIACGILIVSGFLTREASLAMFINISVAILITKIPILLGHNIGPFIVKNMKNYGFWAMAHEMRTDFSMWLGTLFLMLKGGGRWSLDQYFMVKIKEQKKFQYSQKTEKTL